MKTKSRVITVITSTFLGISSVVQGGCTHLKSKSLPPGEAITEQERRDAIRRASVYTPTDIPSLDIKKGPDAKGAFEPNQWVTCRYLEKEVSGKSLKFACETSPGQEVKVKYGARNAEVFGEVLATRLFWALGFAADRMYPVNVRCQGCSPDPKGDPEPAEGIQEFAPAAIERKLPGRAMETKENSGWKWSEIEEIGPLAPPDARAHRDALKLLAAFVQHIDNHAANQRLLCPAGEELGKTGCRQPVLMVQDLGLTFGRGVLMNKKENAVSLANWIEVPMWKEPATCEARLKGSLMGSLSNPTISEAGRAFLASRLVQLSDVQIRDLFELARVKERSADPSTKPEKDGPPATVDGWVNAFKSKRDQLVNHRCPQ